jgi:glycosyltransferase involved in cell wall biosynthesis
MERDSGPAPRRARLLIVGPLPPPIGGVETCTQAILESSAFGDFEVTHCDTTKRRPKDTQGRFDAGNLAWAVRHFRRMRQAVRRARPDVAYVPISGTWSGFLRDVVLGWIARRSGARVVGHQHAGDIHRVLARRGPARGVVRWGLGQFDRMLVLGRPWQQLLEAYGVAAPVSICPPTFRREVVERAAAFRRAPRGERPARGLFVGQLGRRKGVLDLLAATRALLDTGLPFTLTLVGPGNFHGDWEEVLALRHQLGLEDAVQLTGTLQGEALYDRYRECDLFLLPSYGEGLPVVCYEAGAFGMAVVTTPVGAIPDLVVDGRNGLLVEPGNVAQLTAAIRRLALDPELCARLGEHLRQDVRAFHPDAVCARIASEVRAALPSP